MMPDLFRSTFRSLRAHKLRFALTSLGILWGALMLSYLSTNMAGLSRHFITELEEVGPKAVVVWPGWILKQRIGERSTRLVELENEDVERVAALDSVERATPDIVLWSQIVRAGRVTKLLPVNGASHDTLHIRNFEVAKGRFLTPTDVERGALVAFLGAEAAARLFGSESPLSQTIQIESVAFRVIGVAVAKGDQLIGISGRDDNVVLVPYTTAQRRLTHDDQVRQFVFAPTTREGSFDAIRHTTQVIALHHDFDPDVDTALDHMNIYGTLKTVYDLLNALQLFLVAAGVITLFVGAVGVMNIMLVVVGERTAEIGLRKAVGATSRAIFTQFMAESTAVAGLAGLTGSALGLALAQVLARTQPPGAPISSPPVFDPFTITVIVFSLTAVGIVAGVAPAVRAARIPPAEALRAG